MILGEISPTDRKDIRYLIRQDIIKDCLTLDSSQIYAALFGAVQMLIQKVETLEAKIAGGLK